LPLLRYGFWCTEDSEQSSNWREFRNLLEALREEARRARLVGREVWIATDNSTAELAFYKGRSSSRILDELVLQMRTLAIENNFVLKLVHIAGTRMIQIGIDGLSRGELQLGALEDPSVNAIPLHLLTASGLLTGRWIQRLAEVLGDSGVTSGWLFQDASGEQREMSSFSEQFYDMLHRVRETSRLCLPLT
jgi:hypothetical protein